MSTRNSGDTLFLPDEGPSISTSRARRGVTELPPDLLAQSAKRLRVLALLYASVFFMSGFFPSLLSAQDRAYLFGSYFRWVPGVVSIGLALLVAQLSRSPRIAVSRVLLIGLVFEVAGSFGIATDELLDPSQYSRGQDWHGISWTAVWILIFTIVVPSPPRRAVAAALASASAVPLVAGFVMATGLVPIWISPLHFFFGFGFPYLLVVVMAYVGAHVVYGLGREVTRARELGSYRLVERLGSGGMGEVWRAKHRLLARPAAIKLVRPEALGGGDGERRRMLQTRFEREAQATASMRSPHTVELYDFGITDDGTFYYVMELLDGFDLQTLVQRFGPAPPERAIHFVKQVCHSLAEAHAEGLIHRDIKPANVYACRFGRELDFVMRRAT
jgi:serine/threonine-protein kinase